MKLFTSIKLRYLFCLIVICSTKVQSQEDSMLFTKGFLDSINIDELLKSSQKKSYFKIQASYLSNSVYAGRRDTANTLPYLTPSIEYNHKSGIYASASLSYLANSSSRIDVFSLDAGYTFNPFDKLSGSVFINKPFYNSKSGNVQSDIKLSSGLSITYDVKFINITANGNIMFGTKTDFSLLLYIDHTFSFGNEEKYQLTITPTLSAFLGTTGFYQTQRNKLPPIYPPGSKSVLTSLTKFQLLSYELSLPISYDKEKWGLFFTPTFAIPTNPVVTTRKILGPNGGVLHSNDVSIEKLSNTFFAELGFYYRF